MNSGKVRIYELSRELNLDNKDILAVCEQLNISVKSHSSTISDAEAERIRVTAEKQAANPVSPKSVPPRHGSVAQMTEAKSNVPVPVQKKPQILEIRTKPIIRQAQSPEPPKAPSQAVPSLTIAEERSSAKPSAPSRPLRPDAGTATVEQPAVDSKLVPSQDEQPADRLSESSRPEVASLEATIAEPVSVTPATSELRTLELETSEPPIAVPANAASTAIASVSPPSQPELAGPPARSGAATFKSITATPPPLKRSRTQPPQEAGSGAVDTRDQAGTERLTKQPAKAPPAARQPGVVKPTENRPPQRPQTIVEVRRPSRPARPGGDEAAPSRDVGAPIRGVEGRGSGELVLKANRPAKPPADAAGGTTAPGAPGDVQLIRPNLPTRGAPKKGKNWQEEEEDGQDFAEKAAAKVAAKAKRRVQPAVDEEEEDLEKLLEKNVDSPTQISLSLMRPAKPKSARQSQPKAPVASGPKAKKPGSSIRDRRDRREQEAKVEKPEKITLTGSLTVQELSSIMSIADTDIIRTLFMKGIAATVTQTLDITTATMVAQELGVEVEAGEKVAAARKLTEMLDADDLEKLQRRPPVVTIMGHVDHGKTTLLDSIRKTKVAHGEAGGITQHIGAYHVDVKHEDEMQQVVFLDTPGHEAFTAMRARGARVTDIAVLVVAADDGVRPQTVEAISHAKAAEVPIVVAINKIDKEGAQPDRVKQELTEYGLVSEEWGGETIMVPVSALTGENLDTLLEMLLLVSEVEDLYANPDRTAKGTVIEAHLDKAKGPVATLLIQNGTLRVGDTLVAGSALGKVRAMVDDRGQRVKVASPSFAVEVLGLGDVPAAGDDFEVFQDEKEARAVASDRTDEQRQSRLLQAMASRRVSLNTLSARAQEGELKELNLVLKGDVQGSVEAILGALKQLPQNEVQVRVLFAAPGEISETDVDLAAASDAVIIGFNTTLATGARQAADRAGVDVREYNIIYTLLDDIQGAMEGLLDPELIEEPLGQIEVRAVFPVGRGAVAGCYVQSGKVVRNCKVRIRRNGNVVHEGNLDSLKRMKEDAKEVNAGYECGVGMDSFNDWVEGDIIEAYRMATKRRTLSPVK